MDKHEGKTLPEIRPPCESSDVGGSSQGGEVRGPSLPELSEWSLSATAISWIRMNFPEGSTILELGSGDGSAHLAERYKVFSVEHDKAWLNKYERVNYIHAPIRKHKEVKGFDKNQWYNWNILGPEIKDLDYDLIICDGPPNQIGRVGFLKYINDFPKQTPILFDDVHRGRELKIAQKVAARWHSDLLIKDLDQPKHFAILWPGRRFA